MTRPADSSRGLFIDLDGTLADSLPHMRKIYRGFLERHARRERGEEFERLDGLPLREVVANLAEWHGLAHSHAQLLTRYRRLVAESYARIPPREGAASLVRAASGAGMPVALVTSAPRDLASEWLRQQGLRPYFAAVVGGDSVRCGKPCADPYLRALELTGCEPRASVAVEDSVAGATAALGAGLKTYVLGSRPVGESRWPAGSAFVGRLEEVEEVLGA